MCGYVWVLAQIATIEDVPLWLYLFNKLHSRGMDLHAGTVGAGLVSGVLHCILVVLPERSAIHSFFVEFAQ